MKRMVWILTVFALCMAMIPVGATAAEMISLSVKSPSGQSGEITIDAQATVADLKELISQKFSVVFSADSPYRLFSADLEYPNSRLDNDEKVLADIGFASGETVHIEKDNSAPWNASEAPIKIFGLTITGGTGAQEPYGAYSSASYQWNYANKTITLTNCPSNANVTISGAAEEGVQIVVRGGWRYLTLDNVSMENNGRACITINASAKLDLTLKGANTLVTNPKTENGVEKKFPAVCLNQSESQLRIKDGG